MIHFTVELVVKQLAPMAAYSKLRAMFTFAALHSQHSDILRTVCSYCLGVHTHRTTENKTRISIIKEYQLQVRSVAKPRIWVANLEDGTMF